LIGRKKAVKGNSGKMEFRPQKGDIVTERWREGRILIGCSARLIN
jgi:hypothetical protein